MAKTLTMAAPPRKADSRVLLPLGEYDYHIVSFSGGKDSLACVLRLLESGVRPEAIQLWHQAVDGMETDEGFMDWPCTEGYCRAVAESLRVRILFQRRMGGFLKELLKEDARTMPVVYERQDGSLRVAGGVKSKVGTRMRFPQVTADLRVRWCSPVLKIDAAALAVNNEPEFQGRKLLFVTGERREEAGGRDAGRALYAEREPHRCDTKARRVDAWRAVIDWSEDEVWAVIRRWGVVPHPAYRLGFPRVSCMACIFGGPDQWASVRRLAPERFERIAALEERFGCTIKRGQSVRAQADKGNAYPECGDAGLVAVAMGQDYPADAVQVAPADWAFPAGAFRRGGGPI